jgi:hypothetical protein
LSSYFLYLAEIQAHVQDGQGSLTLQDVITTLAAALPAQRNEWATILIAIANIWLARNWKEFDNIIIMLPRRLEINCCDTITLWPNCCKIKEHMEAIMNWAAANMGS